MNDPPRMPGALEEAVQLVELIAATLPVASALVFDLDLKTVAAAGPAFSRHGLGSAAELVGRRVDDIIPVPSWSRIGEHFRAALRGERRMTRSTTTRGGERVYAVYYGPIPGGGGPPAGGVSFSQDITDLADHDQALAAARGRQAAVLDIGEGVLTGSTIECQLTPAVRRLSQALDAELVAIFERDAGAGTARLVAGVGWERELAREPVELNDIWHVEHALAAGGPTAVADVRADERFTDRLLVANGAISGLAVPLETPGAPARVLSVFRRRDAPLDHEEREFVAGVGRLAGVALARRAAEEAALHAALHDPLTGLANRNLLLDRLDSAVRHARRYGGRAAVVFIDLDGFKRVNDTLGHQAGDELLQAVAERLRTVVRDSDTLARYGGDEFVVVAEHLGDTAGVAELRRRAQAAFRWPFVAGGRQHKLSACIGVAVGGDDADARELLRRADREMYRAKADR